MLKKTCFTSDRTMIGYSSDKLDLYKLRKNSLEHVVFINRQETIDTQPVQDITQYFEFCGVGDKMTDKGYKVNIAGLPCCCINCRDKQFQPCKCKTYLGREVCYVKQFTTDVSSLSDISLMTKKELQLNLKFRGIKISGKVAELRARLWDNIIIECGSADIDAVFMVAIT